MKYIELEYQTWEREQSYGMFDYSETKNIKLHNKIIIKSSGTLYRDQENYDLVLIENNSKKKKIDLQHFRPFLKVEEKQGHFFVISQKIKENQDQMCKIVSANQIGYKLKQNDKIRLGKANVQLLRLCWKKSKTMNHYQQVSEPKISSKQSIFACSFYSQKQKNQNNNMSLLESNPACRCCYSKTISQKNPFLALCGCSGHTKYIHQECLIQWVKKRSNFNPQNLKEGIYSVKASAFTCQVCKEPYRMDRLIKQVFGVDEGLDQFAIFYVSGEIPFIYVVDLGVVTEAAIGRSLECSMIINQLSVSRKHCLLTVDTMKKQLILTDLAAKFGTVVQISRDQILNRESYQKGRTKMIFNCLEKMSFFQKIGFCSPHQNLRNQRKSN